MERLGLNTMGPFETTESTNKFILVALDYLTKFVFIKAVPNKSVEEVALFIYEDILLHHGCPDIILTDNGREFKNQLIDTLCKKMNINKKFSSPYRPKTNGLVERTNKTLISILAKNIYDDRKNWDKYFNIIRFNYNIRPQENLGCSPFELVYGRKPMLPYSLPELPLKESITERIQ